MDDSTSKLPLRLPPEKDKLSLELFAGEGISGVLLGKHLLGSAALGPASAAGAWSRAAGLLHVVSRGLTRTADMDGTDANASLVEM